MRMKEMIKKLIEWYIKNGRKFPWRYTKDPYKIMVAEFMLCRTKAEQAVPVYTKFIKNYPSIKALANADFEDIKKFTEHLGLHWRAKHFIESARYIINYYGGKFPADYDELRKIPGIGEYVAGAISVICFNRPAPAVDSNIARFINRYYGLNLSGEIRRNKKITNLARRMFNYSNLSDLLFAIVDFTSLICKPNNPLCEECPIKNSCRFYKNSKALNANN